MKLSILFNSLKESFAVIWKNKLIFLLLLVLQVLFFAVFSLVNVNYQMRILENAKAITDYISQQNIDEAAIAEKIMQQKSILGDDPLSIGRNFNELLKNFRIYLFYLFLLLLLFMSILWVLSHKLMDKNSKKMLKNLSKIFVVLLFYIGAIFLFFYSLFNISIGDIAAGSSKFFVKYLLFLAVSVILLYFMFVSLALINKTELREIVQKTLVVGIKKIYYILPAYFINFALLVIPAYILYYFIEIQAVLFLSMIFIVFSFVFGRVFIINVVEKLET